MHKFEVNVEPERKNLLSEPYRIEILLELLSKTEINYKTRAIKVKAAHGYYKNRGLLL